MKKNTALLDQHHVFLPDFCNLRMILATLVIGELLAVTLSLAPFTGFAGYWDRLAVVSLFVQLVTLTSCWLLCRSRDHLTHLSPARISAISIGIILLTTAFFSEIAVNWMLHLNENRPPFWHLTTIAGNLIIALIVSALSLRYFYLQFQWKRQMQAETQARLEALQARIRPHFLFNSLNTIASLIQAEPDLAEECIEDLADLFRHNLTDFSGMVSLNQELEITRRYLNMEKLRLDERLQVCWEVDSLPLNLEVPALIIQPLVENAIYHGIEMLSGGGVITISGAVTDSAITIDVSNPVLPLVNRSRQGNKMALNNIRQRLATAYGPDSAVYVHKDEDSYTVTILIPKNRVRLQAEDSDESHGG